MSLLTQTKALYESFRAERAATDAAVLQLREFLTNQFGHDGTKAWKEVDERTHTKQKQTPGEVRLRRFQHPLAARHVEPAQVKQGNPIPVTVVEERVVEERVVPLTEPLILPDGAGGAETPGKSEVPDSLTKENLPSTLQKRPAAVADKQVIDLSEVVDLKPKTAASKYTREQLIATLEKNAVPFKEDGSNTQLAATLIGHAKDKS